MMLRVAHLMSYIGLLLMKILLCGAFLFLFINTVIFFSYEKKMAYTPDALSTSGDVVIILGSSVK